MADRSGAGDVFPAGGIFFRLPPGGERGWKMDGRPPAVPAVAVPLLVRGLLAGSGHVPFHWFVGFRVRGGKVSPADPDVVPAGPDDFYPGGVPAAPLASRALRARPVLPVPAPVG